MHITARQLEQHEIYGKDNDQGELLFLEDKKLIRNTLINADLQGALFERCDFRNSLFRKANLKNARFLDCNLLECDFGQANLEGCAFDGSNLAYCNFTNANLSYASFDNVPTAEGIKLGGACLHMLSRHKAALIIGGYDERGYLFYASCDAEKQIILRAGCQRYRSIEDARAHWQREHTGYLHEDCLLLVDRIEKLAKLKGWQI